LVVLLGATIVRNSFGKYSLSFPLSYPLSYPLSSFSSLYPLLSLSLSSFSALYPRLSSPLYPLSSLLALTLSHSPTPALSLSLQLLPSHSFYYLILHWLRGLLTKQVYVCEECKLTVHGKCRDKVMESSSCGKPSSLLLSSSLLSSPLSSLLLSYLFPPPSSTSPLNCI
jgi:hypothetical protein